LRKRGHRVARQRISKQLGFHRSPGTTAPVAEVSVFARAGARLRAALQRQWRCLTGQKARLTQKHGRLAARNPGADGDGVPRIGHAHVLNSTRAAALALDFVHPASARKPGKDTLYRHEQPFFVSPARQSFRAIDGLTCPSTAPLYLRPRVDFLNDYAKVQPAAAAAVNREKGAW